MGPNLCQCALRGSENSIGIVLISCGIDFVGSCMVVEQELVEAWTYAKIQAAADPGGAQQEPPP